MYAIFGPTAVGKSAVAVALGERVRARGAEPVIVSADALQVYRGLDALTGVATDLERATVEHRLIGFLDVRERFSVGAYMGRAHAEIDAILAGGGVPIVVGGTGLYLRAALADLSLGPRVPAEVRERWERELDARGLSDLYEILERRAPAVVERIAPTDRTRVLRALELADVGAVDGERHELWSRHTRHPTHLFGLTMERAALYARIDERVGEMVAAGAIEEVRAADRAGASPTARAALGFEELLRGDVEAMRTRTRRYAKRQITWMRKLAGAHLIDVTGRAPDDVAAEIDRATGSGRTLG